MKVIFKLIKEKDFDKNVKMNFDVFQVKEKNIHHTQNLDLNIPNVDYMFHFKSI